MTEQPLDKYCNKILSVLLLIRRKIRFNELGKLLRDYGLPISNPTLSDHLKHLVNKKIVVRKSEGIQNVTYRVDFRLYRFLDKSSDVVRGLLIRHAKNEKEYKSLSITKQIEYVYGLMLLQDLILMKLDMLRIFEPRKKFAHTINQLYMAQSFEIFRMWLLDNCRENPERLKDEAIKAIDNLANQYLEEHFPEPNTQP